MNTPQPDAHRRPEVLYQPCGCSAGKVTMRRVQVVFRCTGCGEPRVTITGCRGHLTEILASFGGPRSWARLLVQAAGQLAPARAARDASRQLAATGERCMSSDVSRET
jgi:hypothetical protein